MKDRKERKPTRVVGPVGPKETNPVLLLRLRLGLTQLEFAREIGASERAIGFWEQSGKMPQGYKTIKRIVELEQQVETETK